MGTRVKVAAGIGLLVYVWVAAVHYAPGIRARKAARRTLHRS